MKIMGTALFIFGLLLALTGAIIGTSKKPTVPAPYKPAEKPPEESDLQIRKEGEDFWVYCYAEFPGWKVKAHFNDAKSAKEYVLFRKKPKEPEVLLRLEDIK